MEKNNDNLQNAVKALVGLSYNDWLKLKMGVDEIFGRKKSELERELKLTQEDDVQKVILARFG